jgi:2-dehydro-3-deoxyphosphooctonate aldolase (KDO 8-P synthase)
MESYDLLQEVAEELVSIRSELGVDIIFKSSFDKANRTSKDSFRGPGLDIGMQWLQKIKSEYNLPVLSDIHESWQADEVKDVVDIIQIPAFLCRQTDLLAAAAQTGLIVNIKKGQFLSGQDMKFPAEKVKEQGNSKILLTERGNSFGYNNLVVDFRNICDMKYLGYPIIMDCTHSVQRPGGDGGKTGGNREYIPMIARAAKAFGVSGYFLEVHPNPSIALSDGPNMLFLKDLRYLVKSLI